MGPGLRVAEGDAVKVRPILFSPPMIRALLDGRKTQTRRMTFEASPGDLLWVRETFALETSVESGDRPPFADGRPMKLRSAGDVDCIEPAWTQPHYRATDPDQDLTCERDGCAQCRDDGMGPHWRPSIYMPRWASRLTLEVTEVRRERLQDITDDDAKAEGIRWSSRSEGYSYDPEDGGPGYHRSAPRVSFLKLWDSINGKRAGAAWDDNPLVTVISFRVHRCNVDEFAKGELATIAQRIGDYEAEVTHEGGHQVISESRE